MTYGRLHLMRLKTQQEASDGHIHGACRSLVWGDLVDYESGEISDGHC